MSWFTFSLLSIFTLAFAELTQQRILNSDNRFDERSSAVLTFLVQAIITIPIILLTNLRTEFLSIFNAEIMPKFVLVTSVASTGMIYYLKSFKVKNISISTIFVSLSIVVSTSLGIAFLNEEVGLNKIVGILLILSAIVGINFGKLDIERNHFYGLIAGTLFGATYTLDKAIVLETHPIIYLFWSFLTVALVGFLFGPNSTIIALKGSRLVDFKQILYSGFGYFFYNLFTFTAYTRGGEVGKVDAINNSQVFIIILVEFFILKHRKFLFKKILAATIAFTGVIILGIF